MSHRTPDYCGYRFPPEIISHAVWLYHRFSLSFRDVEDLLAERGITVTYETIRQWWFSDQAHCRPKSDSSQTVPKKCDSACKTGLCTVRTKAEQMVRTPAASAFIPRLCVQASSASEFAGTVLKKCDSPSKTGPPYRLYESRTNGPYTGNIAAEGHTRSSGEAMCPCVLGPRRATPGRESTPRCDASTGDVLTACSPL